MKRTVLAVAVMAALLASGCASAATDSSLGSGQAVSRSATPAPVTTAPVRAKNDCVQFAQSLKTGDSDTQAGGRLPGDARPVAMLECLQAERDISGQGEWQVADTVRSTDSVEAFVSALRAAYVRAPQPTPTQLVACDAIAYLQPWVVLIDADGTAYRVAIPLWGICPAPDSKVVKALAAVKTRIASTERIRQTESAGAVASGCDQQFGEMAYAMAQFGAPATTRPFFPGSNAATPLRVCYYKLEGTYDKAKPAGDFESAATLTGSREASVYNGLMTASVATGVTCAAPAAEYAVLFTGAGGADWSVVELGGCKLAAPDSGPERRVPASVIEALLAAER